MTTITQETTSRGFRVDRFIDGNDVKCSLQESSRIYDEPSVWLGCSEIDLKRFVPQQGWEDIALPKPTDPEGTAYLANTRMHLSQSQVRDLLPALTYFAEHGCLPDIADPDGAA